MATTRRLGKLRVLSLHCCRGLDDRAAERLVENMPTLNKLAMCQQPLITKLDLSNLAQLTDLLPFFLHYCNRLATVSSM